LLIHRMTASFGKLAGQTLELKNGLNILQAPNETGKSTWCAFLLSMFYGINSRERDKAGFIADKNRYAPWNGSPMGGRLDCNVNDIDITLTRSTRRQTAPMADFKAVYSGTGTELPNLTSQTCGEQLLGVSREVYERSAFIRQAGLSITQDAGLERRIASLISTGDEETSFSESMDSLKKQLNRRRHNKTGQIPALETELQSTRRQLEELHLLEQQLKTTHQQIDQLSFFESELSAELAHHAQWEAFQKQQVLADAEVTAQKASHKAETLRQRIEESRIPENDTIGRLRGALINLETTRKALDKAREERDAAAKILLRAETAANESPFAGQTAENVTKELNASSVPEKWNPVPGILGIIVGTLISFGTFYLTLLFTNNKLLSTIALIVLLSATFLLARHLRKRAFEVSRNEHLLKRFGTTDPAEISALADTYINNLSARDAAQAELDKKSASADTLYNTLFTNEQAILLEVRRFAPSAFDSASADAALRECAQQRKALSEAETAANEARMRYELLAQQSSIHNSVPPQVSAPQRNRNEVVFALDEVRRNLATARSAADRLAGQLQAIGDPVLLNSTALHLEEKLHQLESEYDAIRLAMDSLEQANTTLQNRFSPALGQRAAEIFKELTDGQYRSVVLDRTFHLSAEPAEDTVYRDAQLLSAGAVDQLYLATRLAICDMILPQENPAPIILDDALTNFDDIRCATALRWLKEAAKTRQILLFTCHSREAEFFSGDKEVFVQQLTNSVQKV